MKHGKGKMTFTDGSYYDGDWEADETHGYGVNYNKDNSIKYSGKWVDGYFEGK